jgi:hypothetical protein
MEQIGTPLIFARKETERPLEEKAISMRYNLPFESTRRAGLKSGAHLRVVVQASQWSTWTITANMATLVCELRCAGRKCVCIVLTRRSRR